MSEDYVKIETNIKWYNTSDILYLVLYQYLVGFLGKIKERDFVGMPMMSRTKADEIGAVYNIDESDYVAKELPHPCAGEEVYTLHGLDENGELFFSDPEIISKDAKVMSVPMDRETVFVDMPATLEALIAAYDAAEWDKKGDWWAKASQIVPHMWD
jgi:hypothetical protein